MAHIHEIGIAADTKAFDQGIRSGVIRPAEDAVKAFEKMADSIEKPDYSNVLSDLEGDLKDVGDAAERAGRDGEKGVERLEEALRDAQKETEDLGRKSREAGADAGQGFGRMRAASEEVTQEIGSNLGEAVSSIRGDLSDLGQVGQDTMGGLAATVAGMGPGGLVGAIALAAGATGLGLLTAGLQDTEERQERLKEQAGEWAQAYVEAGQTILTASQIVSRGNDIFGDPEKYAEAQNNAKLWGVEISTAVAAMAGSQNAIDQVSSSLDRQSAALEANAGGADNYAQNIEAATTGQSQANSALLDGRRAFDELTGAMDIGAEMAGYQAQMMVDVYRNTQGATEAVDEFGDTVITLPDGKQVYIDAETGRATEDTNAIEQKIYGIQDKSVTVRVDLDDSAVRKYRPPTLRAPMEVVLGNGRIAQY